MPVILDKRFLDGEFLVPEEALRKYHDTKIEPLHDTYRLWDHNSFKDFERRKGQVLHASEVILRIQQINPLIFVQHQINFEDDWGLYTDVSGKQVYLSALSKGWLTEFSYTLVDDRDLPTEERRGWRTVLLRLMGKGVLAYDDVVKEFGESEGANSDRWLIYSTPFRNNDASGVIMRNLHNEA